MLFQNHDTTYVMLMLLAFRFSFAMQCAHKKRRSLDEISMDDLHQHFLLAMASSGANCGWLHSIAATADVVARLSSFSHTFTMALAINGRASGWSGCAGT